MLQVIEVLPKRKLICKCDCGNIIEIFDSNFYRNNARAVRVGCGCTRKEAARIALTKHGYTKGSKISSTYRIWGLMKHRCTKKGSKAYDGYGLRGITYCKKWESFEGFLEDMGEKPEGLTLDRIDNDGNYEKNNCRWATSKEQANNRRKRRKILSSKKCLECKKEFQPKRIDTKFCNRECYANNLKEVKKRGNKSGD